MKSNKGSSLKKRNNKMDEASQKGESQYFQYALFDMEASDLTGILIAKADGHGQHQSSQSVDIEPESVAGNRERDIKSYFTPKEIVNLMIDLLDPLPETAIYDPCCGSGAMLMATLQYLEKKYPDHKTALFGQEPRFDLCTQAKTELLHSSNASINICDGDTLQEPKWLDNNGKLERFDYVISNPPWNQEIPGAYFSRASYKERFEYGKPKRYADWGWIQHILASLSDQGRAVILTSMGAITRGVYSGSSSEQRIRTQFILHDDIETVIRLPDSLFADVTFPCALLILNRHKPVERQKQILEIDASQFFITTSGEQPEKRLTQEGINTILDIYKYWETRDQLSKVVTTQEVEAKRYSLNPSVYNRALPHWDSLEEICHKVEPIREEHCCIYTEIAVRLDNQYIADLALSGDFSAAINKIVASQSPQDKSPGITLLRQHIPHLQSLIRQEITLEEEYKQSLMYGFFTDPIWRSERLGTVTTVRSGGNPPTQNRKLYGNEFCWVRVRDLNNGRVKSTTEMLSKEGVFAITSETRLKDVKLAKGKDNVVAEDLLNKIGTVLVAKINGCEPQGKLGILEVPAATNVEVCCIEPRPDDFLPDYLLYYITYIRYTWADYASQTRKEPRVENAVISDTQVVLPPKEKQQEIVERLQEMDTIINSLKREMGHLNILTIR
jgi:type I restriction-modification system DNA methylase subunit